MPMCQPRFFSPFLLCSLRLAARDEASELTAWLAAFHLQELREPVKELVDAIRSRDPAALAPELTAPPGALERAIAGTMCSCAVDPEQALTDLDRDLDPTTVARITLCVQAIGLALNSNAGRLQRAWSDRVSRSDFAAASIPAC